MYNYISDRCCEYGPSVLLSKLDGIIWPSKHEEIHSIWISVPLLNPYLISS